MTRDDEGAPAQYNRQQALILIAKPCVRAAKMTMQATLALKKEYTNIWSQTIQSYSDYLIRY